MRTTPVVNRHTPPAHGVFRACFAGEGQGLAYLSCAHQPGRPVTTLDGRRVGGMVAQALQSLRNPLLAAIGIADFNRLQAPPALMLDDLHMGCCPGNVETGMGV